MKLPIDSLLPEVVAGLQRGSSLVLEAPPGAGKTTRVPRALLEAGFGDEGEILVLQPRRLPTRLAATRVAEELGEEVGGRVGYQFRFEKVGGPGTRIRFLTEGSLTRRLIVDPSLQGVSTVILDELHERHLVTDLSLALLRRLQREERRDLKLLAMSATLDGERIAAYLGTDQILRSEGRRFDVEIEHLERPDPRPLHEQVAGAVKRLLATGLDGHVLVFLPGAAEIRLAAQALASLAEEKALLLLPLHGDLPPSRQDLAIAPSRKVKILLSTNVAETSVTIEGIAAVIDSGLVRVAGHSPFSGLPTLQLGKISKSSAVQRAGRAGRTRAGRALRLYTQQEFLGRSDHDVPEILRIDLAETLLALRGMGLSLDSLEWLDPPQAAAVQGADALLRRLGALEGEGLGEIGRRLLAFPVHPRLGRWIVEGERLGVAKDACLLAALASERDIRSRSGSPRGRGATLSGPSDLLELASRFQEAEAARFDKGRLSSLGLDPRGVESVRKASLQLQRIARKSDRLQGVEADDALLRVILGGFSDRVAKRRTPMGRELLLSGGGTATLSEESVVHDGTFLVAVAADERQEHGGRGRGVTVRLASKIEPEWLLDGEEIEERDEWVWNPELARVERWSRILYGSLTLDESRGPAQGSLETTKVLVREVLAKGLPFFFETGVWEGVEARLALGREHFPEAGIPTLTDETLRSALEEALEGLRSFEEISKTNLLGALLSSLLPDQLHFLARHLPVHITLPGGRRLEVHYEMGKPPWIESRMQDFFGMTEGPSILGGRVPLTLHLLAPNRRAVQVTQDLRGFWERHYPSLRRELGRRYPRHAWPEDGSTAEPPAQGSHRPRKA